MSLLFKALQELAALLKNRQVSPVELVKESLRRIDQTEPKSTLLSP